MRERARDKGRLEDIIEYSTNVTNLIEGYSLEALIADKRTYYSVMKNIEVVGEAAYMLTKAFKKLHSEIPWKVVQGMRHVLVHDYANVVSATLYDTAVNDMLPLRQQAERYLAETDWDEWALRLVFEWLDLHRDELLENWERLSNSEAAKKIAPLE